MPVAFVPHGGGPVTHVEMGFAKSEVESLGAYWRGVRDLPPPPPKALLVVSAHREAPVPKVMTSPHPPMLYDYSGIRAQFLCNLNDPILPAEGNHLNGEVTR